MPAIPKVTVFGSCRVHTPCTILARQGKLSLNQENIYGFVHSSREILQQIEIITGKKVPAGRLRPFLNIPEQWKRPETKTTFDNLFEETDVFVVEISSIRLLRFKAFFLQINRTRELLTDYGNRSTEWWLHLVRTGCNSFNDRPFAISSPVEAEVIRGLTASDQSSVDIVEDLCAIASVCRKKIVFVSHFNTDYERNPILQRARIVDAFKALPSISGTSFLDPTGAVLKEGIELSIKDLGHYTEKFESEIARLIWEEITRLLR
jgi:hypothetical protein